MKIPSGVVSFRAGFEGGETGAVTECERERFPGCGEEKQKA